MSSERQRAIYVDEMTFNKINELGADFKTPNHFLWHVLKLYEKMIK